MSDEKHDPVDDLKQGLGLLFRAAKGAAEKLPTDRIEGVAKEAVKEVSRAFETIGQEVEKAVKGIGSEPAPPPATPPAATAEGAPEAAQPPAEPPAPQPFDDAYAPEPPPKGPRVG